MKTRHLLALAASCAALGFSVAPSAAQAGSKVHFQIHVGTPYVVHHPHVVYQPYVVYHPQVTHHFGHQPHHAYRPAHYGYGHHHGRRFCQIAHGPPRYHHDDDD